VDAVENHVVECEQVLDDLVVGYGRPEKVRSHQGVAQAGEVGQRSGAEPGGGGRRAEEAAGSIVRARATKEVGT